MKSPLSVAIIGSSGYTGDELVRLCVQHPHMELKAVTSRQLDGKPLSTVAPFAPSNLSFENLSPQEASSRADVFFLALPHGVSAEYAVPLIKEGKVVIDLSADFRLKDPAVYADFYKHQHPAPELLAGSVYGLPEFYSQDITQAQLIACPGCYPTSILLALVPLLRAGLVDPQSIVINSLSGVSGAGRNSDPSYQFCECNENARAYGLPRHRHLAEIEQELARLSNHSSTPPKVLFVPHLVPLTRGMLSTISALALKSDAQDFEQAYRECYQHAPFVKILSQGQLPQTKHVIHSNRAEIGWSLDSHTGRVVVVSAIDNLGKGAAWQAVQAFNVKFGFDSAEGLRA